MSESVVEATASAVTHKTVKAKATGRQIVIYTVETDMGSFTTAKRDLAAQAHKLIDKPARYSVKTEQRGDFTNYYLEDIHPAESAFPQTLPKPRQQDTFDRVDRADHEQRTGATEKDMSIYRQVAAKVSAQLSNTADEFWTNLDDLVAYFATGKKPGSAPDTSGGDGFVHSDDDIPF